MNKGMNGNDVLHARGEVSDTTINCDGGTTPGANDSADMDALPNDAKVSGCGHRTRHWSPLKPVTVTVDVPNPRADVYEFLDVLANHEPFTDHLMVDWKYSGPRAGVGAKANARVKAPGSNENVDIEVVEADPPQRIVEESVSAGGKRRTRGTYTLEELPEGGTRISFEFAWLEAPRNERMTAPLMRAFMRRANGSSMRRLGKLLRKRA